MLPFASHAQSQSQLFGSVAGRPLPYTLPSHAPTSVAPEAASVHLKGSVRCKGCLQEARDALSQQLDKALNTQQRQPPAISSKCARQSQGPPRERRHCGLVRLCPGQAK